MKKQITIEQWNELNEEQKWDLCKAIHGYFAEERLPSLNEGYCGLPNIGQMIEFLGDDLTGMTRNARVNEITIVIKRGSKTFQEKELCEALWEAVKQKLTNNQRDNPS